MAHPQTDPARPDQATDRTDRTDPAEDGRHIRALAETVLRPLAEAGEPGRVNRPLVAALGAAGLLARLFPGVAEGHLTGQAGAVDLCLLRENLARVSTEAETALALQGLGGYPILQSGPPELVDRWIPAIATGEAVAAAHDGDPF